MNADLLALGEAMWAWRAATQPISGDDIPRIERPPDWAPDWSADGVSQRRQQLAHFQAQYAQLAPQTAHWTIPEQVDYRLLGSALARVHWELDVVRGWQRNPQFYVHQTLGALFEPLLPPPPFDEQRARNLIQRAESIPATLQAARINLAQDAVAPFAQLALSALDGVSTRLDVVARELAPLLPPALA